MLFLDPTDYTRPLKNKVMKMKINYFTLFLPLILVILSACNDEENPFAYSKDTHSRGATKIYIEESFKPLFDTSIYTFESQFPRGEIKTVYKSEGDIIQAFYDNKIKTICISRDFTSLEKRELKKAQVEVRSDKIAEDALALIIHPSNPDSILILSELKDILLGKTKQWPALKTPINIVFDNENSANYFYLKRLFDLKKVPVNMFAVKSNAEVISYVKENKNALGIIGLNWISDADDFDALNFVNGITVMSIAKDETTSYYKPFASYIYTKEYPLAREIWMINKAKKAGLAAGFILFMKGDKGQLIIQKSALVPANSPIRLISLETE